MPTSQPEIEQNFDQIFLRTPDQLAAMFGSHGLRPFGYFAEFSSDPDPTQFANPRTMPWEPRLINLEEVQDGYGVEEYVCRFTTWDPTSVEAPNIRLIDKAALMKEPKNGDVIRIRQYDVSQRLNGSNSDPVFGRIIFQGTIRQVHVRQTDTGVTWAVEAISDVTRLNDPRVTLTANYHNDPIHPSPHFDSSGNMVLGKLKTVADLIKQVMQFTDAWGSQEYFTYKSINWIASNGDNLETSPKCGGFIPSQVTFQDTPKGSAILELLQRAGNYTIHYDPGTQILQVVELNLACNHCGSQWPIAFVSTDSITVETGQNYAFNFTVKEDNTDWNSKQTANVCRITSGPVRFYSGHGIIAEYKSGASDPFVDFVVDGNDTVALQKKRSMSLDNFWYRFSYPSHLAQDKRKQKRYFVGAPLFPDWNIHEDYLPAFTEIQDVVLPPGVTSITPATGAAWTAAKYRGQIEWQTWTVGDSVSRGVAHLGHTDNLRVYQAWHAPDDCPACAGSGLVAAVYTGSQNEPQITFEQVGTVGNPRFLPRVTNYIFDPYKFGNVDPQTGEMYLPTGLTPWTQTVQNPYPLPWKNLCPYCRATGKKPEWKIRNIQTDLFAGRNNQIPQTDTTVQEYPVDPDATATGPETWEEAQTRILTQQGPFVQVENFIDAAYAPSPSFSAMSFDDMNSSINTHLTSVQSYPHPLTFKLLRKRLAGVFSNKVSSTDNASKIVPDAWDCNIPFTTIDLATASYRLDATMGRVIFQQPVFIPCRKPYSNYPMVGTNKHEVLPTGLLRSVDATNAKVFADTNAKPTGFWRHARVWMTFFYTRENYFQNLDTDADGKSIRPVEVAATSPDGDRFNYLCRAKIIDGQYALEVRKENPVSNDNVTEFDTGNRVMPVTLSDNNAWVEIFDNDLLKMIVPPSPDIDGPALETYKKTRAKFDFYRGKVLKMERTTPGEEKWEMEGYIAEDFFTSRYRPKVYTWRLRDDRPRLLSQAIRELEVSNKLQVSGTLLLVGLSWDVSKGLGYIDYPNRGKTIIKRLSYRFEEGFLTELELTREEARAGEIVPKQRDMQNQIQKDMTDLKKFVMTGGNGESGEGPTLLARQSDEGRRVGVGQTEIDHVPRLFFTG